MADGIEMISDLSSLDRNLQNLAKNSEETSKKIVKAFQGISREGVKPLMDDVKNLSDKIKELGGKSVKKNPLESVSKGAAKAVDDVNKVAMALDKIVIGDKTYSNSKLTKMNSELDSMYKKLGNIQTQLHTAMDLEKEGGINIRDKYANEALHKEADELMRKIQLLERERAEFIRTSQDKIKAEGWYRKIRNRDDGSWKKMEQQREREKALLAQEAKAASDTAKIKSELYARESESYKRSLDSRKAFYEKWINETYEKEKKLAEQSSVASKKYSEEYARSYNERLKMYARMFDEINTKERASIDAKNNSAKIASESYRKSYEERRNFYEKWINETYEKERKTARLSSRAAKESSDAYRKSYNERRKFYEKWINDTYLREKDKATKAEAALDAQRYQEWLKQKHIELLQHNRIEEEKLAKKRSVIAEQQSLLAQQRNSVIGAKSASEKAKKDNDEYRKAYEERRRFYERLINDQYNKELENKSRLRKAEEKEDAKRYQAWLRLKHQESVEHERAERQKRAQSEYTFKKQQAEFNRQQEMARKAYFSSFSGAMESSKKAKSILEQTQAIKNLIAARDRLNKTDSDYQKKLSALNAEIKKNQDEIDKAKGKTDKLAKSHRGLMDITGQLTRRLALMFSVSQITGYINKMMEVRGEFEMQQRSLQVLLKNKEQANQLWDKTLALAIKSPFRVKELITYTKQLAAYRVEADKLYDTNKMLADVSAGLGVDMNRLILAFGQVKAANYLRGTELRQFSEAGVNILEELSKYYSEVEKKAVSVGDVFEMVSNRMVKFTDVEEIFKRITSEGGLFYNMQEEQSKTLKGIMMNLRDSYDIMLNEIGKDSNSSIKAFLKTTKYVVDNWRAFLPVIKSIGMAFLFYFSGKGIRQVINAIDLVTTKIFGLQKATSLLGKASPWLILASAIGAVIGYLSVATSEANRLRAALNDTDSEYLGLLEESIDSYIRLTKSINDATKSTKDRAKAMSNLKSKFDGILPQEMLEEKYVRSIKGNYDEATEAMTSYYNEKARMQKKQKIETIFEEDIQDVASSLQNTLIRGVDSMYFGGKEWFSDDERKRLRASINGLVNEVIEEAKRGEILSSEIYNRLLDKIVKYTGVSAAKIGYYFNVFGKGFTRDLTETIGSLQYEIDKIQGLPGTSYAENEAARAAEKEKKNVEIFKSIYSELVTSFSQYAKMVDEGAPSKKLATELTQIQEETEKQMKNLPERFQGTVNSMFHTMQESAEKGSYELKYSMSGIYSRYFNDFIDNLQLLVPDSEDIKSAALSILHRISQVFRGEAGTGEMTDFQKQVNSVFSQMSSKYDIGKNIFADLFPSDSKVNRAEVLKNIKSEFDSIKLIVDGFKNSLAAGSTTSEAELIFGISASQIDEMEKQLLALNESYQRLGGERIDKKEYGKQQNEALKRLKLQIQTLKDAYSEYTELRKQFNKDYSDEQLGLSFAERFANALLGDVNEYDFSSKNGLLDALNTLRNNAEGIKDGLSTLLKDISKTSMEIDIEADKNLTEQNVKKIEGMFGDYEISLELDKLDMPKDLAKRLFGLDAMSLDELRDKVKALEPEFDGTEDYKKYLEFLKKIDELEDKARVERLKKFSKFLRDTMDEIKKVQTDGAADISFAKQLFDEGKIGAGEYSEIVRNVVSDVNKNLNKINLDKFKDSADYIAAMGNLVGYTNGELEVLRNRIEGALSSSSGSMSVEEVKAYQEAIENIDEQIEQNSTFFGDSWISEIREYLSLEKELTAEKENQKNIEEQRKDIEREIIAQESTLAALKSLNKDGKFDGNIKEVENVIEGLIKKSSGLDGLLNKSSSRISALGKRMKEIANGGSKSVMLIDKIVQGVSDSINATVSIFNDTKAMMDSFGKDTNAKGWAEMAETMNTLSNVNSKVTAAWASFKSGDVAGTIANSFGAVTSLISGINKIHDIKYERKIQREIKFVEKLEKQYEKLSKAIEDAYAVDTLNAAMEKSDQNIKAQIASREKMIKLEEDKKKTDKKRIEEWREEIEQLQEQQEDFHKQQVENMGGTYDYKSAAEEFTNAWLEAYKETGDGLDGLKKHFREFAQNLLIKQAVMRGAAEIIGPLETLIAQKLEDYKIDDKEWEEIDAKQEGVLENLNDFLRGFFEKYKAAFEDGGDSLTGLQKGIQGITEDTAEVLAAYLNSVRFFVADTNSKFTQFLDNFLGEDNVNPMVSQLKIIARNTESINSLFESVVMSSHPRGGSGIRVFLD